MDISVVIPAYGELEKIPRTLDTLQFDGDFEVIVAGDELSKEDLQFLRNRGVVLDASDERRGKASAINHAAGLAKGELLVFLDSDTRPEDGEFLSRIWEAYRSKGFDMAAGKLMVEGGGLLGSAINVEYMLLNSVLFLGQAFHRPVPANGAFIIVTKEGFQRMGGFDRVAVEDFQLGFKANRAGLEFNYLEEAAAYTAPAESFREWLTQRKRWMLGGWDSIFHNKGDLVKDLPVSVAAASSCYPMLLAPVGLSLFMFLYSSHVDLTLILSGTALFTSSVMLTFNRILNWGASLGSGLGYLLLYGPMWTAFMALSLLYYLVADYELTDWKL